MKHKYIIISDSRDEIAETKAVANVFPQLVFAGSATNYDDGLDLVLNENPHLIFLEIQPADASSKLGLSFVSELYRFLTIIPQIIVTAKSSELAFDALKYDVLDYLVIPFRSLEVRKALLRAERLSLLPASEKLAAEIVTETPTVTAPIILPNEVLESIPEQDFEVIPQHDPAPVVVPVEEKPLIICVKSYGDYRFIEAKDIWYLQADNNSTDIHLSNGEMITAFKTLKQFENVLPFPFARIHNSYIVNIDYVSRIHTGNSVCYLKNSSIKLPFSKSYKENVDSIISGISNGNYLEF